MADEPEEYCTVVYRIKGGRVAAQAWWELVHPLWMAEPVGVIAVARFDAIEQLDAVKDKKERSEVMEEALDRIAKWADAYPTDIFPVPDDGYCQKAHEVLKAHGMTVDRISADAMRHALRGVGRIARAALKTEEDQDAET